MTWRPFANRYDIVFNTIGESAQQFCINHVSKGGTIINASGGHYVPLGAYGYFYSYFYVSWLKLLRVSHMLRILTIIHCN